LPIREFEPRTIKPVASRCTDCSIPATRISAGSLEFFFLSLLEDKIRVRNFSYFSRSNIHGRPSRAAI
jgi:hypothetical protein